MPQAPTRPRPANDRDLLLGIYRSHPDDQAPLLVYADWLEEHGQASRATVFRAFAVGRRGLSSREQVVLYLRWGIPSARDRDYSGEVYSLRNVGRILKISKERVRRIEIKAKNKLGIG